MEAGEAFKQVAEIKEALVRLVSFCWVNISATGTLNCWVERPRGGGTPI